MLLPSSHIYGFSSTAVHLPLDKTYDNTIHSPSLNQGSSLRLAMLGLLLGSLFSILCIILHAARLKLLVVGMVYSFFLILAYVSLSELVSNGGRPHNNVYLKRWLIGFPCVLRFEFTNEKTDRDKPKICFEIRA